MVKLGGRQCRLQLLTLNGVFEMATKPKSAQAAKPAKQVKTAPKAATEKLPEVVSLPTSLPPGTHKVKYGDDVIAVHVFPEACVNGVATVKKGKRSPDWAGGTDSRWTAAVLVKHDKGWTLMRSHKPGVITAYPYTAQQWKTVTA
jgi:hypothetical protein